MNCKDVQRYVHAFIDGELDPQLTLGVEAHVDDCEACRHAIDFERWFKVELRRRVQAVTTPAGLDVQIQKALAKADRSDQIRRALPRAVVALAVAVGIALAVVLPEWLSSTAGRSDRMLASPRVVDCVADRHARNLPVEVTGPDAVSVSRWFRDKVDFPVNPPLFAVDQVNLLGGRISNVGDRQAAYLIYERSGHRISVTVFDGSGFPMSDMRQLRAGPRTVYFGQSGGYGVALWQQGGVAYAVSSDLTQNDMVRLVSSVP